MYVGKKKVIANFSNYPKKYTFANYNLSTYTKLMSKKKKNEAPDQTLETVESALSKTERYIEDNQKSLTIIVAVLAAIIAIYLGYKKFYLNPLANEASGQMFGAEQYFEADSFKLALYGDGNYAGFIDIIEDYGLTKSANLANYYAGISYLNIGEYEEAITYLKNFKNKDVIVSSIALGAIGDAYVQLNELNKAIEYFSKAADNNPDKFSAPLYLMKLGRVYEKQENYDKALKVYTQLKKDYPNTAEGRDASKYITKVEALKK